MTISRNTTGVLAGVLLLAATATPAPAWETPFWLSADGVEASGGPRLEIDGKGNAWFLWVQDDGGHWRVNVARKSPGLAVEAPVAISEAGIPAWWPELAVDKKGNVLATWAAGYGTQTLQAAYRAKGELVFEAPDDVSAIGSVDESRPAFDGKGGALIVYERNGHIESAARPKKGEAFGVPSVISVAGGSAPCLAFDKKGNALAGWYASDGMGNLVTSMTFRPKGGTFATPTQVSDMYWGIRPEVTFDKKGNAMAIWSDAEMGSDARATIAQMSAKEPGVFGTPSSLSTPDDTVSSQNVIFDKKGNALAYWARYDGSTQRIETAFRPRDGEFSVATTVPGAAVDAASPEAVFDSKGNAYLIWSRIDGPVSLIEVAYRPVDGVFGTPIVLYSGTDVAGTPTLVVDKKGNAVAAWARQDGVFSRIEAAVHTAP